MIGEDVTVDFLGQSGLAVAVLLSTSFFSFKCKCHLVIYIFSLMYLFAVHRDETDTDIEAGIYYELLLFHCTITTWQRKCLSLRTLGYEFDMASALLQLQLAKMVTSNRYDELRMTPALCSRTKLPSLSFSSKSIQSIQYLHAQRIRTPP